MKNPLKWALGLSALLVVLSALFLWPRNEVKSPVIAEKPSISPAVDRNYCASPGPRFLDTGPYPFQSELELGEGRFYNQGEKAIFAYTVLDQESVLAMISDPILIGHDVHARPCKLKTENPSSAFPVQFLSCGQEMVRLQWNRVSRKISFHKARFPEHWKGKFETRFCGGLVAFWSLTDPIAGGRAEIRANVADLFSGEELQSVVISETTLRSTRELLRVVPRIAHPQWDRSGKAVKFSEVRFPGGGSRSPASERLFEIPEKYLRR